VSVSVLLGNGVIQGRLTKESGQLPALCRGDACAVCNLTAARAAETNQDLRRSYMVFAVLAPGLRYAQRVFAKLERTAIEVVLRRVVRLCLAEEVVIDLFKQLSRGLFSSAVDCGCSVEGGICEQCGGLSDVEEQRRFVYRNQFSGVYPEGKGHWFAGVTDAPERAGQWWLRPQVGCLQYRGVGGTLGISVHQRAGRLLPMITFGVERDGKTYVG
jgi:hypothetical protein